MTYASVQELPEAIQTHMPMHAREIYRAAFNSAWSNYADQSPANREQTAHRVAWAAVKRRYRREGEYWVERE